MWALLVLSAVVAGGALIFNSLVKLREQADAAWSDIDVQLKRRHDLIPALVEVVKGYADHERGTFDAVIQARSAAMAAAGPAARGEAEGRLQGAVHSLIALSEGYPELRASDNFRDLQNALVDVEDHIQAARRYYNAVVRDYDTRVGQVPSNLVARTFGFHEREFFQIVEPERAAPRVGLE